MKIFNKMFFILVLLVIIIIYFFEINNNEKNKNLTVGELFYKKTSLSLTNVMKDFVSLKFNRPKKYKTYETAKKVKLPKPDFQGLIFEDALKRRRSIRNFSDFPLTLAELSQLLFAAQGITGQYFGTPLRAAPSAGALYPIEIYCIVNNIDGLDRGIYHYRIIEHSLELLKLGDFRKKLIKAGLAQEMLGKAAVTFVLTAIFDRSCYKYGNRGYRYVYIEAGHISENIYLQATSLGLGSVAVGAFFDSEVNKLIGIDGKREAAIYLHSVGKIIEKN